MEINRHCTAQSHSDCALLSSLHLQSSDSEQEARHPFPAHMAECGCEYSCQTAVQTLDWIQAIVRFIEPYIFLMEAHVVNFFKDRLWEAVDKEWMDCLREESVQNLLLIPSGVVQGHWPASLKKFVHTLRCLSFPRDQADLQTMFPGLHADSLSSVLIQGMSMKKKHEVEVLSAIVSFIAKRVGAHTIIDVGAGQYQHSVVAIDASSHHGRVTDARAERIKKHYAAQMRRSGSANMSLNIPKTITCEVSSIDMLKGLSMIPIHKDANEKLVRHEIDGRKPDSVSDASNDALLVLAGLHSCGDLSVTMLRTFIELDDVKAVVSIGCCYNLLSEVGSEDDSCQRGFPVSSGIKSAGISLGKCSRDLACQSAERWRSLKEDSGLHNFELHAFRAAFQMVLLSHYPEVMVTSPSIGRQGKAMRRQQQRRILESSLNQESSCRVGSDFDSNGSCNNRSTICERAPSGTNYSNFEEFSLSGLQRLGLQPLQDMDLHWIWKEHEPFMEFIGPYWSLRAAIGGVLETLILLDSEADDYLLFFYASLNEAANYLNIKGLLDLTCQTVVDMIKGKTPEEIRKAFNIKNNFTPEEEEEVRRENQWAFE
ncbi:hypothetical protein CDL15_Pgr002299 [Punica granatum]|uniref:Methyltransferase domain-containing protein n=1 Tax=Punica granatum TaxID=22663 RepID=A0A218XW82_PUNGR|nr:hypothetical protein CDL15_Pgr002299 [Punica granatum]